jgi:hypothetical protein
MAEEEPLDDDIDSTPINDTVPMVTHVPFMVYKVSDPNMRVIDQGLLEQMPYNNWTETKFFEAEQIQEIIATEYPD